MKIAAGQWRLMFVCGASFPRRGQETKAALDLGGFGPQAIQKDGRYRVVVYDSGIGATAQRPTMPDGIAPECLSCTCRKRAGHKARRGFFNDDGTIQQTRTVITCHATLFDAVAQAAGDRAASPAAPDAPKVPAAEAGSGAMPGEKSPTVCAPKFVLEMTGRRPEADSCLALMIDRFSGMLDHNPDILVSRQGEFIRLTAEFDLATLGMERSG